MRDRSPNPPPGRDRRRATSDRSPAGRPRGPITAITGGRLPKWVRDEILHSTGKDRREPAINLLGTAVVEFAEGRYRTAARALREAKELSPRAATIRELLGLSEYELGDWEEALRELRTFRRLTGVTDHVAVELDCLRALGRPQEVTKAWETLRHLDFGPDADREARVVYGSFLLDQNAAVAAWEVVKPGRLGANPTPADVRLWFVACKVALAAGNHKTAATIFRAIRKADPGLAGLDELADAIAKGST